MNHPEYVYEATLRHVVDGDTYDLSIDLGFGVYKDVRVRLMTVDTDEIYGVEDDSDEYQRGIEQTEFVKDWFGRKDNLIVSTFQDETGKYGRHLVHVWGDGDRLDTALMDAFEYLELKPF